MKKSIPYIIIAIILLAAGVWVKSEGLLSDPVVSIRAELLFPLGPLDVTNAVLTAWVVTILIFIIAFLGTRNMALKPSGLQNFLEFLVEGLYNLTESVSGPKWVSRFFAVPATIFIFVLMANLFGLFIGIPLVGVGVCEAHPGEETHVEEAAEEEAAHVEEETASNSVCAAGEILVPFFRAPSADLNFTFALAVITQVVAWFFGVMALGVGGFLGKFFVFGSVLKARSFGGFALGLIDVFVGLLELLSEFVKIVAFSFRLFGNIFAGEVMLLVVAFLVPLVVITPLIGFEIFVAGIQAFVFYILSVAFYRVAITGHGDGDHDEAH